MPACFAVVVVGDGELEVTVSKLSGGEWRSAGGAGLKPHGGLWRGDACYLFSWETDPALPRTYARIHRKDPPGPGQQHEPAPKHCDRQQTVPFFPHLLLTTPSCPGKRPCRRLPSQSCRPHRTAVECRPRACLRLTSTRSEDPCRPQSCPHLRAGLALRPAPALLCPMAQTTTRSTATPTAATSGLRLPSRTRNRTTSPPWTMWRLSLRTSW